MSTKEEVLLQIQELTKSSVPEVADAAIRSLELVTLLENNEITSEEFDDLIDDVLNIEKINQNMSELELNRQIVVFVQTILTLKSLMSIF